MAPSSSLLGLPRCSGILVVAAATTALSSRHAGVLSRAQHGGVGDATPSIATPVASAKNAPSPSPRPRCRSPVGGSGRGNIGGNGCRSTGGGVGGGGAPSSPSPGRRRRSPVGGDGIFSRTTGGGAADSGVNRTQESRGARNGSDIVAVACGGETLAIPVTYDDGVGGQRDIPSCVRRSSPSRFPRNSSRSSLRPSGSQQVLLKAKSISEETLASLAPRKLEFPLLSQPPSKLEKKEWHRVIEEKRKEIRQLRAEESAMKWDLVRAEKKAQAASEKAEQDDVMEWRWRQSEVSKQAAEERRRAQRESELRDSKDLHEFKRQTKVAAKKKEQEENEAAYVRSQADAAWNVAVAKVAWEQRKERVAERFADVQERKELEAQKRACDQEEQEAERQWEEKEEMAEEARRLEEERAELLSSLTHLRSKCDSMATSITESGRGEPLRVVAVATPLVAKAEWERRASRAVEVEVEVVTCGTT
eukprot:TRINITY_DN20606_c0_g1_i1.p1 TRINITY_DN20606_c0_g1~~TRINITY_DN20606_c0_g1_i1.p1  ORF type:complete len:534 (+),score=125.17 TRINITY_DN20606_c0_g1_i1:177-1604(+)